MTELAQNIVPSIEDSNIDISVMNRDQKDQYLKLLKEKALRIKQNKILQYFPETGPLSRHNYPKHMMFFRAGATHSERCIMAANRVGKSEGIGAPEVTYHATGRYPDWWEGKRFDKPINAWAAGATGTTARDIVQYKLIGPPEEFGTGMIPAKYIIKTTPKAGGVPNAVDTILVRHISGGISRIKIKSYAEGRKSFEGTEQDLIWLDEECPLSIYTECVTRTMTTDGHILLTFTPLEGITETVQQFMVNGSVVEGAREGSSKFLVQATWDDAPHLTQEQKDKLFEALPPHQREARSKGIPSLGSGAIYPILESNITVEDFPIPDHWHCCYALDVGWKKTAVVWFATDPTSNITYIYSEYYRGQAEPVIHAEGIKTRGNWIPGAGDYAGANQDDGTKIFQLYLDEGLDLARANKAVEAGLYKTWQMLSTNKLKVFRSCVNWFAEFRLYRRDENGKIIKENDHLMDATRYGVMSALDRAIAKPFWEHMAWEESEIYNESEISHITGY